MTDDDDTTPATTMPKSSGRPPRLSDPNRWLRLQNRAVETTPVRDMWDDPAFNGETDEFLSLGDDDAEETDDGEASDLHAGPGHLLMDRSAIAAALHASGFDGSFETLSREEEARARLLIQYRDRPQDRYKPHLIADHASIGRLDALLDEAPNLSALTRLVIRSAHLSRATGQPLKIPPLLIVGPPGVGKTRYMRRLAEALVTDIEVIVGSNLPDTGSLHGYNTTWRGAKPGRVAKAALAAKKSGLIIFLDECEKCNDYERIAHPLDVLLPLLEQHTASCFVDDYLQVPMRLDKLIWVFAANSRDGLSAPFLDRVVTITVPDLTTAQRDAVLQTILADVVANLGLAMAPADAVILAPVRALSLRRARLAVELACGAAVEHGRQVLRPDDIAAAMTLLEDAAGRRRPIGFLHPRRLGVGD